LSGRTSLSKRQLVDWIKNRKKVKGNKKKSYQQIRLLQESFEKCKYVEDPTLDELVQSTGLNSKQIRTWFATERFKTKK
jgi:hypothetical protein